MKIIESSLCQWRLPLKTLDLNWRINRAFHSLHHPNRVYDRVKEMLFTYQQWWSLLLPRKDQKWSLRKNHEKKTGYGKLYEKLQNRINILRNSIVSKVVVKKFIQVLEVNSYAKILKLTILLVWRYIIYIYIYNLNTWLKLIFFI